MKINYSRLKTKSPDSTELAIDISFLSIAERACYVILICDKLFELTPTSFHEHILEICNSQWDIAHASSTKAIQYAVEHEIILNFTNEERLTEDGIDVYIESNNDEKTIIGQIDQTPRNPNLVTA